MEIRHWVSVGFLIVLNSHKYFTEKLCNRNAMKASISCSVTPDDHVVVIM